MGFLLSVFLALLLIFIGFPQLSAWYEAYKKRQLAPSRQVYLWVRTVHTNTLQPIDSVYVQVIGDQEATGYSNERGLSIIAYEAEQGENEISIIFIKEGYLKEKHFKLGVPASEGDTTYRVTVQLTPDTGNSSPGSESILN